MGLGWPGLGGNTNLICGGAASDFSSDTKPQGIAISLLLRPTHLLRRDGVKKGGDHGPKHTEDAGRVVGDSTAEALGVVVLQQKEARGVKGGR